MNWRQWGQEPAEKKEKAQEIPVSVAQLTNVYSVCTSLKTPRVWLHLNALVHHF